MHTTWPSRVVTLVVMVVATACATLPLIRINQGYVANPMSDTCQCVMNTRVCIGNQYAATNEQHLRALGVTHIVSAIGVPSSTIAGIRHHAFDVDGGYIEMAAHWEVAYQFIHNALESSADGYVLVHCAAGVSRSAAVVIYFLIREYGMTYTDAYQELKRTRDVIEPDPRHVKYIQRIERLQQELREIRNIQHEHYARPYSPFTESDIYDYVQ